MYYICKKKEQSLGVLFGIMDTNDGVVEYYSPRDIIDFVKEQGLKIEGVQLNTETGKWNFKVLKPTAFVEAETSSYSEDPKVVNGNTSVSEISHKELKDAIEVSYPEDWGILDNMDEERLDKIFKPWKAHLDAIIYCLDIPQPEFLDFIDGCDCVGYYKLAIPNNPYFMSIYTNPAYASEYYTTRSAEVGKVVFQGIGIDIMGLSGKSMDECHFDSPICDDFVVKFKEWLSRLLGSVCLQEVTDFISLCRYAEKLLPKCESLNYNVAILNNDGSFSITKDYQLEDLSTLNLTQDYLNTHYLQAWFCASSTCSDNNACCSYLYFEYHNKGKKYRFVGDGIYEDELKAYEATGFPKGVLKKICKDNAFVIEGSYQELMDYIKNLLSNSDVLTQDSDCLKHFIEIAKKVEARFTDLYRNNILGIEMNQLLDISIMINGDDCFNLLAEPNFSVSCPNGYSFTKFVASSCNSGEGYLMFGFDGNKYSVFVDACEPDRFGFKTMKKDKLLFYGEEKSLISWLSKVVI